jgi:hypothetical protein
VSRAPAPALVFGGALVVIGGVAALLYHLGSDAAVQAPSEASEKSAAATGRRTRPRVVTYEPEPPPPTPDPMFSQPPTTPEGRIRFLIPGHESLRQRDWKEIAESYVDIVAEMRDMSMRGPPQLTPGGDKRQERMQRLLARFQAAAMNPPDGSYPPPPRPEMPHPAYAANLIAALLAHAKAPLTDEQSRRLETFAREHSAAIDGIDAEPIAGPESFALEQAIRRGDAIDAFFADAYGKVLTPEQGEIVAPSEHRARVRGDFLCSNGQWGNVVFMPYASVEELADVVAKRVCDDFDLQERFADVRAIVEPWARNDPLEGDDELDRRRNVRVRRVAAAAKRTLELDRALVDGLKPPPELVQRIRESKNVYLPQRK